MSEDSLFYGIMITSPPTMLADSFRVSFLCNNVLSKAHFVEKEINLSFIESYWVFAWSRREWKRRECWNFMKSHILVIEPSMVINEKMVSLPPNEFRWQKKRRRN